VASGHLDRQTDIQILRGIAVTLVVLFHWDFAFLQSGFLGVDIFFVISGYLMAALYRNTTASDFFMRRAKRLLPGYFVVTAVTLALAFVLVIPVDFEQVADQVFYSSLFIPNVGFWFQNSYFDKAAFKPFLHFWSLGVEIQFYLLFPLILLLERKSKWILIIVGISSFLLCLTVLTISPKTSFFLTPFRIWQFLIGFWVARIKFPDSTIVNADYFPNHKLGSCCLAVLLLIPFSNVDGQSLAITNGHPGLVAMCMCLVTAGVLLFQLPNLLLTSVVGRSLEKLGDWSYSIYLGHFPIIVLYNYSPFSGTQLGAHSLRDLVFLIVATVVVSASLYILVERRLSALITPRHIFITLVFLAFGSIAFPKIQTWQFSIEERALFAAWKDRSTYRCGKLFRLTDFGSDFCSLNQGENLAKNVMLLGDSHADAIKTEFSKIAAQYNTRVFFAVDNNPLMSSKFDIAWLKKEAIRLRVRKIYLHFSPKKNLIKLTEDVYNAMLPQGIEVILILPVPVYVNHVPQALYDKLKKNTPVEEYDLFAYQKINEKLYSLARTSTMKGIGFVDIAPSLCSPKCKIIDTEFRPLYFDSNHLTLTGATYIARVFEQSLSK
jgi:peptidoglycan/LPS O-acetylase OafA/YrhL